MHPLLTYFFAMVLAGSSAAVAAEKVDISNKPTYRFSGDAQLLSHFLDRGLSITDNNPALTASFLFNLGQQFRFGFWGSNISNVTSSDDNLWLKFIADVKIEFSTDSTFLAYFHDDHFYKHSVRNGQAFGMNFEYKSYMSQIEWLRNYQGTYVGAVYLMLGKNFPLYKKILPSAFIGYTMQNSDGYLNYFDVKATAIYTVTSSFELEAGITAVTNSTQFDGRGAPAIYFAIKLTY